MRKPTRAPILLTIAAALLFIGVPLVRKAAVVWTDYLWYADLSQTAVFWTRITSQLVVGAIFALATFVLLYANLRVARSLAPRVAPVGLPEGLPVQVAEGLERLRRGLGPILDTVTLWASLFVALVTGASMASQWETFRIALTKVPFGYPDPQFGRDVGFFVFTLPAHEAILAWMGDALVLTIVFSVIVHLADGAIQPWARLKGFAPHVKAHLSVLLALIVMSRAYNYWLDIYRLDFSTRGQVTGASYTDVHAQLPAYQALIVISIATALALLLNIRYKGWRLPVIALAVWVGASILVGGIYPSIVQRFVVAPNEAKLERPFIERNITSTREAFDLSAVKGRDFPVREDLTAQDVIDDEVTLRNVRLWDPNVIKQAYGQLQTIRPYYEFADVDVDRYLVNGQRRQVLVSAREVNSSLLADTAQTWVNRHLVYTHGFGLVISPASEFDSRGLPRFLVGDIPPRVASTVASGSPDLKIKQPRIYYGEDTLEYVLVDTGIDEFDYPMGEKNATYRYDGDAGVMVGSLPRRIAWAIRFGASQILFSGYVSPTSRVLIRRNLRARAQELAPWLSYENDPYPIVVDGRILWVLDAYTHSDRYPYSQGLGRGASYLRNSVKVVIDAFTGETTFYAFDEKDPVLKAWRAVFPTLVQNGDKIPAKVREHFRYPQALFSAQAEIYRTYHMTDPQVFYNKEDQWEIPGERAGRAMEPFFVLLRLPGEVKERFYLMQPYTPRNRDNMIGWMAASCDPDNFGQRTVYMFPKERVVYGPEQVKARINQDPGISPQLSLWNQRGSQVVFGNMIVLPIRDSIVYIQPIFLQAEQTGIPQLTRVVVVYSDKVQMAATLEDALLAVFGQAAPTAETSATPAPSGTPREMAAAAAALYREAIDAQRKGDWAAYGAKLEQLGKVLERLASQSQTGTARP